MGQKYGSLPRILRIWSLVARKRVTPPLIRTQETAEGSSITTTFIILQKLLCALL